MKGKTYHAQSHDHGTPKANVVESLLPTNPLGALQHYDRQLQHLANKSIATNLFRDTRHDDLMPDGGDEEGNDSGREAANMRSASAIYVTTEEAVDRNVPLAREFHPVGRVPPVRVEVAIGKVGELCKSTEGVLKDDQEDQ